MQESHHALELAEHRGGTRGTGVRRGVGRVRCEEPEGVVAPRVLATGVPEPRLGVERVHGQQLEGRHADAAQVGDGARVRDAGVRPAQVLGDVGVRSGERADVRLVHDGPVQGDVGLRHTAPVEGIVDHDARPPWAAAPSGRRRGTMPRAYGSSSGRAGSNAWRGPSGPSTSRWYRSPGRTSGVSAAHRSVPSVRDRTWRVSTPSASTTTRVTAVAEAERTEKRGTPSPRRKPGVSSIAVRCMTTRVRGAGGIL